MIARAKPRRGKKPEYPDTEHWVATKRFESKGKKYQPGDVVPAQEWNRPESWERAGYIERVPAKALEEAS